jgi:hypothetical protein
MLPPHQLPQYEITPEVSYVEMHGLIEDDRSTNLAATLTPHGCGTR